MRFLMILMFFMTMLTHASIVEQASRIPNGVMDGYGSVSGGASTYTVPVNIPPGRELKPNISFEYNLRYGNGVLGMGWALAYATTVKRCLHVVGISGYQVWKSHTNTTALCYDDDHLTLVDGEHAKDGAEYRKLIEESFLSIKLHGDLDSSKAWFSVKNSSGKISEHRQILYGANGKVAVAWMLTREIDVNGNTIDYEYDTSLTGEMVIKSIWYTGKYTEAINQRGTRHIQFIYEDRPDMSTYYDIVERRLTRRLSMIQIRSRQGMKSQPVMLREYRLSYQQSELTGRSLLQEITECGRVENTGEQKCRIPTKTIWSNPKLRFHPTEPRELISTLNRNLPDPIHDLQQKPVAPFIAGKDFDGDGGVDIRMYKFDNQGQIVSTDIMMLSSRREPEYILENANQHFDNTQWTALPGYELIPLGITNWLDYEDGQLVVKQANPKQSSWKSHTTGIAQSQQLRFIDIDPSTPMIDLVSLKKTPNGKSIILYRNQTETAEKLTFSAPITLFEVADDIVTIEVDYGFYDGGPSVILSSDIKSELVLVSEYPKSREVSYELIPVEDFGIDGKTYKTAHRLDMNGDDLTDLVYSDSRLFSARTWRYQLNTGKGFAREVNTGIPDTRHGTGIAGTLIADVNSDGNYEILYPDKLIESYCMPTNSSDMQCSSTLQDKKPDFDLGIYSYVLAFFRSDDKGRFTLDLESNSGLHAQANVSVVSHLFGQNQMQIISPNIAWFSGAGFNNDSTDQRIGPCPANGCGASIYMTSSATGTITRDSAPDSAVEVWQGPVDFARWNYYTLTDKERGIYQTPTHDSPDRFIDINDFYFTSRMMVVGESEIADNGNHEEMSYEYGGNAYNRIGRGLLGFRWIKFDYGNYRDVYQFAHSLPYTGKTTNSWYENDNGENTDYLNGKPSGEWEFHNQIEYTCNAPQWFVELHQPKCNIVDKEIVTVRNKLNKFWVIGRKGEKIPASVIENEFDESGYLVKSLVSDKDISKHSTFKITDNFFNSDISYPLYASDEIRKETTYKYYPISDVNGIYGIISDTNEYFYTGSSKRSFYEYRHHDRNENGKTLNTTVAYKDKNTYQYIPEYNFDKSDFRYGLIISETLSTYLGGIYPTATTSTDYMYHESGYFLSRMITDDTTVDYIYNELDSQLELEFDWSGKGIYQTYNSLGDVSGRSEFSIDVDALSDEDVNTHVWHNAEKSLRPVSFLYPYPKTSIQPCSKTNSRNMGNAYQAFLNSDYDDVASALSDIDHTQRNQCWHHLNIAIALKKNNYPLAEQLAIEQILLNPYIRVFWSQLSSALLKSKQIKSAISVLDEAITFAGNDRDISWLNNDLALVYLSQMDFNAAKQVYSRLSESAMMPHGVQINAAIPDAYIGNLTEVESVFENLKERSNNYGHTVRLTFLIIAALNSGEYDIASRYHHQLKSLPDYDKMLPTLAEESFRVRCIILQSHVSLPDQMRFVDLFKDELQKLAITNSNRDGVINVLARWSTCPVTSPTEWQAMDKVSSNLVDGNVFTPTHVDWSTRAMVLASMQRFSEATVAQNMAIELLPLGMNADILRTELQQYHLEQRIIISPLDPT